MKSPINGALKTIALHFPGVNAWATKKSFKVGHRAATSQSLRRTFASGNMLAFVCKLKLPGSTN